MVSRRRRWVTGAGVPLVLLLALLGLLSVQVGATRILRHHQAPEQTVLAASTKLQLGVATTPLARNWWREWGLRDLASVDRFERGVGAHVQIVMWYADWEHNRALPLAQLRAIAARGSVPEITWEPWDASKGLYHSQPRYLLRNIIDGRFDTYVSRWARQLAVWGGPVFLRFAQEMDGNWYPWDDHAPGNHNGEFIRAWRHVHDIFTRAGARNVRWVWSPAFAVTTRQFPGRRYVDVLGLTCLNSGRSRHGRWRSFARICARPIHQLHRLVPDKPIQLSEVGTAGRGGSRATWIAGLFAFLQVHPEVRSLVWFNVRKSPDWVLNSSPAAQRRFARGLRSMS